MENYTKQQVDALIRNAVSATVEGIEEWIKECTVIKNESGDILQDAILDVKDGEENTALHLVSKHLIKKGIKFDFNK